jgi:hypothetical protein
VIHKAKLGVVSDWKLWKYCYCCFWREECEHEREDTSDFLKLRMKMRNGVGLHVRVN